MGFDIRIDYRLDTDGFFERPGARAALEAAAADWAAFLGDDFAPVPEGVRVTVPGVADLPDAELALGGGDTDLVIFARGAALGEATLARGGPVYAPGDPLARRTDGDFRGLGPVTDFEPYAGVITFATGADWSFDLAGPRPGRPDFLTTARHEIAHVLGVSTAPAFFALVEDGAFAGPNTRAANGGAPVPLEADGHIADGFDRGRALLDPTTLAGTRKAPTAVDLALLADIGYRIEGFAEVGAQPPLATPGPDTIFGTAGADTLDGGAGADAIEGADGADRISGGAGGDALAGGGGADTLDGGAGDDLIAGGDGDDMLHAGPGEDRLDGGTGRDTALYAAPRAALAPLRVPDGTVVLATPEGRDTLSDVERIGFEGGAFLYDLTEPGDTAAEDLLGLGYRLYAAALGRLPGEAGLRHWHGRLMEGMPPEDLAAAFAEAPEFRDGPGAGDDGALVDALFAAVLGRPPAEAGRAHWTEALATGAIDRPGLLLTFAEAAETRALTAPDLENGVVVLAETDAFLL